MTRLEALLMLVKYGEGFDSHQCLSPACWGPKGRDIVAEAFGLPHYFAAQTEVEKFEALINFIKDVIGEMGVLIDHDFEVQPRQACMYFQHLVISLRHHQAQLKEAEIMIKRFWQTTEVKGLNHRRIAVT